MDDITWSLLLLLLLLLPLSADGQTCDEPIRLSGKQHRSSIYCSSCLTYVHGKLSSPVIQLELPALTQLTGISVQQAYQNHQGNSKRRSYFIEYRRTQDGPWRAFGQRRTGQSFIERHRLFFNAKNKTRTFLPSLVVRQIRLVFLASSPSSCAMIELFGCPASNGLISTRFSSSSLINTDLKYDGWITNSSARGGLGMLTDGETSNFLHWSSGSESILLLFAFDSIKEFQSIELDLKCPSISTSCTLKIDVGIFEIVRSTHPWSNQFRALTITNQPTLTHLILAIGQNKGQFVILRLTTDEGLTLSEVTFNNRNEFETDDVLPSSIYVENNLHRLELALFNVSADDPLTNHHRLWNVLVFLLLTCAVLFSLTLISSLLIQHKHGQNQSVKEESFSSSLATTSDEESNAHNELYSNLDLDDLPSVSLRPISSHTIINETAKATIRTLTSVRDSVVSQYSLSNEHFLGDHLSEISSSEIVIIENLGQCFFSELGERKVAVLLHEKDNVEYFSLSKLVNHWHIVSCLGYVNVSPERCLLVSEHSRVNLFDYCQTMSRTDDQTLIILMRFLHELLTGLVHLESLNLLVRDLTLPNCLLFAHDDQSWTVKLSDYARLDTRYASRYVEQLPMRWLPSDVISGEEPWSIQTNIFMFGTLLFELLHLGSRLPYGDLSSPEVCRLFSAGPVEPSLVHFPRPELCNDRLYALIEWCLSPSSSDRPSFREIILCLNETTVNSE